MKTPLHNLPAPYLTYTSRIDESGRYSTLSFYRRRFHRWDFYAVFGLFGIVMLFALYSSLLVFLLVSAVCAGIFKIIDKASKAVHVAFSDLNSNDYTGVAELIDAQKSTRIALKTATDKEKAEFSELAKKANALQQVFAIEGTNKDQLSEINRKSALLAQKFRDLFSKVVNTVIDDVEDSEPTVEQPTEEN